MRPFSQTTSSGVLRQAAVLCSTWAVCELSLGKLHVGKKSLEVPLLLRSHSASPQGPEEFDAFPKVTNVLAISGFQG